MGSDGYLAERGLTPLSEEKRMEVQKNVMESKKLGS
jgi:phosphate transport system substrate-binding protein